MRKLRTSQITAQFAAPLETVWEAVTDNTDWSWRSDLDRIEERPDDITFVEYPKKGSETVFTITEKQPLRLYAFHMEHAMFFGDWTGEFAKTKEGGTEVVFTERLTIRNPVIWALSFLLMDLKGMQETYILDLRRRLGESDEKD